MREDEGDWRLRTFERSFRRIRCGMSAGIEGRHENGILGDEYCAPKSGKEYFFMIDQRPPAYAGRQIGSAPPR